MYHEYSEYHRHNVECSHSVWGYCRIPFGYCISLNLTPGYCIFAGRQGLSGGPDRHHRHPLLRRPATRIRRVPGVQVRRPARRVVLLPDPDVHEKGIRYQMDYRNPLQYFDYFQDGMCDGVTVSLGVSPFTMNDQ